ncbi:MAG: DUF3846 domain-containing protein [Bacteroidales bacterium]|nr:DUF3846 domain-containing protein [Bacteroidales bacterium]
MVKCIKCEPHKKAEVVEIDTSVEGLQEAVGGWFEFVYPARLCDINERLLLMCNEEGKLEGLEPSRILRDDDKPYDVIAGTCYIMYSTANYQEFEDMPLKVMLQVMDDDDWKEPVDTEDPVIKLLNQPRFNIEVF